MIGSPKAPVTMVYYGDLECPICKEFTLGALPSIVQQWVRSGKLKIEYRALETATHEPEVFKTQQVAALAAGKQKKMWDFLELFYREQGEEDTGYVTESYLQALAQAGSRAQPHTVDERPQQPGAGKPGERTTRKRPTAPASRARRRSSSERAEARCTPSTPARSPTPHPTTPKSKSC